MDPIPVSAIIGAIGILFSGLFSRDKVLGRKYAKYNLNQLIYLQAKVKTYKRLFLAIVILEPVALGTIAMLLPEQILYTIIPIAIVILMLSVMVYGSNLKKDSFLEAEIKMRTLFSTNGTDSVRGKTAANPDH